MRLLVQAVEAEVDMVVAHLLHKIRVSEDNLTMRHGMQTGTGNGWSPVEPAGVNFHLSRFRLSISQPLSG